MEKGIFDKQGYTAMVKSGEVYEGGEANGEFWEHDSRARQVCVPLGFGYSGLAAIQY